MSDLSKKPRAHYAPIYAAALYPELAEVARAHGYALAVHGSMARDMDLICVPWTDAAAEPQAVVDAILSRFDVRLVGQENPKVMKHGRLAYWICVGFGDCAIDLSFMPRQPGAPA